MDVIPGNSLPNDYQLSPALEKHVGAQEFKDDRELGGVVIRRLITPATECYQPGQEFIRWYDATGFFWGGGGTMLKIVGQQYG